MGGLRIGDEKKNAQKKVTYSVFSLSLSCMPPACASAPPLVLHKSTKGCCKGQHQERVMKYVRRILDGIVRDPRQPRRPLVFDIDDTLIDGRGKVIEPVASVFRDFRDKFPVFIVTARPWSRSNEAWTRDQLSRNGLDGYRDLSLMPKDLDDVHEWKWRERRKIASRMRLPVLFTMGDRYWDVLPPRRDVMHLANVVSRQHGGHIVVHRHGRNEVGVLVPQSDYRSDRPCR